MNKVIAWALKKFTDLDARDYTSLLQLADGYAVTEMIIESKHWLVDKTLAEMRLSDEGVLVLGIHRGKAGYKGIPRAGDEIHAGDTLILYGKLERLHELDRRRKGEAGDHQHKQSVKEAVAEQSKASAPEPIDSPQIDSKP
jgi:Trk K+ transport system NAD-binding subunit